MDVQYPGEGAQQTAVVNPVLRFDVVCRVCGNEDEINVGIFREDGANHELALKMNTYLPIDVVDGDSLPPNCCWSCVSLIVSWHELVAMSVETDRKLKELLVVDARPLEVRAVSPKIEIGPVVVVSQMDTTVVKEEDEGSVDFRDTVIIKNEDEDSVCTTSVLDTKEVSNSNEMTHLESLQTSEKPKCKVCCKSFSSNSTLFRHKRKFHRDTAVPYECDINQEPCSEPYTFSVHCQTRVAQSNACDACGKRFPTVRLLRLHQSQAHATKLFVCEVCGAQFRARSWLAQHVNVHSDERPYACDVCGKAFRQPSTLYMHKRCHDSFQFSCDACGKGFRRRCYLRKHVATRHSRNCDLRGKSFRLHKGLQQHMSGRDPLASYSCGVRPAEVFERSRGES